MVDEQVDLGPIVLHTPAEHLGVLARDRGDDVFAPARHRLGDPLGLDHDHVCPSVKACGVDRKAERWPAPISVASGAPPNSRTGSRTSATGGLSSAPNAAPGDSSSRNLSWSRRRLTDVVPVRATNKPRQSLDSGRRAMAPFAGHAGPDCRIGVCRRVHALLARRDTAVLTSPATAARPMNTRRPDNTGPSHTDVRYRRSLTLMAPRPRSPPTGESSPGARASARSRLESLAPATSNWNSPWQTPTSRFRGCACTLKAVQPATRTT